MSRRCMVTGKRLAKGNNVSHANNRTRRDFLPNVQDARVFSETLGRWVKIRVSAHGLRTLDHKGGLDALLKNTPVTKLDPALRPYKKQLEKTLAKTAPAKKAGA